MISLEKTAGLPLELRDDYSLAFGPGLTPVTPAVRDLAAMKNYLKDPFATAARREIYFMYRDVAREADRAAIAARGLTYDITVIPPGLLGEEFAKTIGHYHMRKPNAAVRYPEIYEVLAGQVFWILQRASADLERLEAVYVLSGRRGDKLVIPPGYGHVSINPADSVLVLANWQARQNRGEYEAYESHNGAAYYVIRSALLTKTGKTAANFEFVPNLHYNSVPELQRAQVRELPQYDLRSALPMYFTGMRNLQNLDFLMNPENYLDELVPDKLFVT